MADVCHGSNNRAGLERADNVACPLNLNKGVKMTAKELLKWIKEHGYKFEPHETAQSNGEMLVLTEVLLRELESIVASPT